MPAASDLPDATAELAARHRAEWERAATDVDIDELDRARRLIEAANWSAARVVLRRLKRSADADIAAAAGELLARLRPDAMAFFLAVAGILLIAYVISVVYR